jgi:predicted transcriptional regulator of viral defense system
LILWWLWSRDRTDRPTGVYGHQTALSLHELTDVNSSRLDMTVPASFRRGAPVPRILRLHHGHISEPEHEALFGVPVTNALRTILDVWEEGSLSKETLRQAFRQARSGGKITKKQAAELLHDSRFASIVLELEAA